MLSEESEEFIVASECPMKIGMNPSQGGCVKGLCCEETNDQRSKTQEIKDERLLLVRSYRVALECAVGTDVGKERQREQ